MKQSVGFCQFCDAFRDADRNDSFSYEGKQALFDLLAEYEYSIGEEIELDVIALCCDFNEGDWEEVAKEYSIDLSECEDDDEREEAVEEYLRENTQYVKASNGSFIYQAF